MLELIDVHGYYGEAHILHGISIEVKEGETVSLLGRNGVGKTTTLRCIMGLTRAEGQIVLNGKSINNLRTFEIARLGINLVPEDRRIFSSLTVRENILIGSKVNTRGPWTIAKVLDLFPSLAERMNNKGNQLSGGEQQMLTMARCLMTNPKIIMLDEPCEGLSPLMVKTIKEVIQELQRQEVTILLVEQNLQMSGDLADRHYILNKGTVCFKGTKKEIMEQGEIVKSYLGVGV